MQAKISKFIAAVLALVIIFANSWSVVSYAAEVFLSEKELENQNTTSKDGSVDFDVQYTNGKHSATLNIDEKNTKLNIAVSLKKSGYVKDLAIDFSSSNFEVDQINDENTNENGNAAQTTVAKKIQNFDAENKKITLLKIRISWMIKKYCVWTAQTVYHVFLMVKMALLYGRTLLDIFPLMNQHSM